jgi:predicted metal-dependent enzyme (double-stranded beta helix superfamily)
MMQRTVPVATDIPEVAAFASRVETLIDGTLDEYRLTEAVRAELSDLLAAGFDLPEAKTRPNPERYVMYPLYVSANGSFSIASAVWDVGQGTPVHGHETWGVVGIYRGTELETRFEKPAVDGIPLVETGRRAWGAGEVSVCCTTFDDVHEVKCGGDVPVVGIHVYGADIGVLPRRSYNRETGTVHWFTSTWAR